MASKYNPPDTSMVTGKVASLKLTTTDPKEAAEAYAKMVDGGVK